MNETELREIDKRVHIAIYPDHIIIGDTYSIPGMLAFTPMYLPHYTATPAAADLVRQEIERRGWRWWMYFTEGTYTGEVEWLEEGPERIHKFGKVVREFLGESTNSHHEALCLAFLAACEAQEQESKR